MIETDQMYYKTNTWISICVLGVGGFRSLAEIQAGIHETLGSGHFRGQILLTGNEGSDGLCGPERRA